MGFLATIGTAIAEHLKPTLIEKANGLIADVTATIKTEAQEQIRQHMPAIIEALVKAAATGGAQAVTGGVDKATDLIPGTLDDRVLDPLASSIAGDFLRRLGLG
jgi:hypothetical protein